MKYSALILAFFLTACGPSQKEKDELIILTCNIISESRNMDGALRLIKVNETREKIDEPPYLFPDDVIKESIKYGLCYELVSNDKDFLQKITTKMEEDLNKKKELHLLQIQADIERMKLAKEREEKEEAARIELERIQQEKIKKEQEIAEQKRLTKEKELQRTKLAYKKAIRDVTKNFKVQMSEVYINRTGNYNFAISCLIGFSADLILSFKDNSKNLRISLFDDGENSNCKHNYMKSTVYQHQLKGRELTFDSVSSATLFVRGFDNPTITSLNKKLNFPDLQSDYILEQGIEFPVALDLLKN
jgi:hypothetical protein